MQARLRSHCGCPFSEMAPPVGGDDPQWALVFSQVCQAQVCLPGGASAHHVRRTSSLFFSTKKSRCLAWALLPTYTQSKYNVSFPLSPLCSLSSSSPAVFPTSSPTSLLQHLPRERYETQKVVETSYEMLNEWTKKCVMMFQRQKASPKLLEKIGLGSS